jgi:hypothetical protein
VQRPKLDWLEEPGKDITGPETFVFGNRLVEALTLGEKYGRIERRFCEAGVVARISGSPHRIPGRNLSDRQGPGDPNLGRAIRKKARCL